MMSAGIMALTLFFNLGLSPAAAPDPDLFWKTVAASGPVAFRPPCAPEDSWLGLRRGDMVSPLSHVRAQERGRTTVTRRGDLILVAAGSEVVLPDEGPDGRTVVLQSAGRAFYKVAPRSPGGRFVVQTPYLVAGVKGTSFSVLMDGARTAVSVVEGIVEVRSVLSGETRDVGAGQTAIVDSREGRLEMHSGGTRDRRGTESAAAPDTTEDPEEEDAVEEIRKESVRLSGTLDSDAALLDVTRDDLWADLDGALLTSPECTDTLSKTTTRLDPAAQDVTTDTSLLDAIPLLRRKP